MKRRVVVSLVLLCFLLPACRFLTGAPIQAAQTAVATSFADLPSPAPASTARATASPPAGSTPAVEFQTPENPGAPEVANYDIAVRLDVDSHTLEGEQTITYLNTANEPFHDLVFHLYLNAFKHDATVFMRESGGQLRGFAFNPQSAGFIEVTGISLASGPVLELELLEDGTLARAELPQPVQPGESVEVEVRFRAQLPEIFARTGWVLDQRGDPFFLVGQWFPKLGVWSDEGWIADVFHGNAEFFANFGRYRVAITLPEEYAHGATGLLTNVDRGNHGMQTAVYEASGVIDFVWVASPYLQSAARQVGNVELRYLYLPEHEWSIEPVLDAAQSSFEAFSEWFGPYPYERLTISDVPEEGSGAGGMEYPTFITVGAVTADDLGASAEPGWTNFLEVVTVHEVAHQWWQSLVATNEAREPWLDEGFADYSTTRYFVEKYGLEFTDSEKDRLAPGWLSGRRSSFLRNPDLPMHGTAWDMPYNEYVIAAYSKPDMALITLEGQLGEETMLEVMQTYFERYRFGHPTTQDFEAVAQEVSGQPLDWFFDRLVYGEGLINWRAKSLSGETVTVVRDGNIPLPVEVEVTFEDGGEETVTCTAEEVTCSLAFPGEEVETVMVDPQRKLMIDIDWEDNSLP